MDRNLPRAPLWLLFGSWVHVRRMIPPIKKTGPDRFGPSRHSRCHAAPGGRARLGRDLLRGGRHAVEGRFESLARSGDVHAHMVGAAQTVGCAGIELDEGVL